jgi:hypothetical protein
LCDSDQQVYEAFTEMVNTLLTDPEPLGGIKELPRGDEFFEEYVKFLLRRTADIRVLGGLLAVQEFLRREESSEDPWPDTTQTLEMVRQAFQQRITQEILRQGIQDISSRWLALRIIRENRIHSLLPDVQLLLEQKAEWSVIKTLAELGDRAQFDLLFRKIPELVNLEARSKLQASRKNVHGPEHANSFEYAEIIKVLGKLGTPEAIQHLKCAFRDYDPTIRSAACQAIVVMDRSNFDLELAALIEERLKDAPSYVVKSAEEAARWAGINPSGTQSDKSN